MRKFLLMGALGLAGCAEHNFVPGSPLARLNGYNRTYEQIASDDCVKYGFVAGTDMHRRCVYELAAGKRQNDAVYMAAMGRMAALGTAIYATSQPQYGAPMPGSDVSTYLVGGRVYTCSTTGAHTNCF